MSRLSARTLVLAAALLAMAACNNNPIITTPTPGSPLTDTLTGTLSQNGGFTQVFTISTLGAVTVDNREPLADDVADRGAESRRVDRDAVQHEPADGRSGDGRGDDGHDDHAERHRRRQPVLPHL